MSNMGGSTPPMFAENAKFNGLNWVTWKNLITIAANLRGVSGCLDGTIPAPSVLTPAPPTSQTTPAQPTMLPLPPSPPPTTSQVSTESPWEATNPAPNEWKVRNVWTMGLLIYNTTDPVGLGINIQGTAADAWKSYTDTYEVASEIAILNAEEVLHSTTYIDGQDFNEFISQMRTRWSNATALGSTINDKAFRTLILRALPRSWDPIVATLYTTHTSRDAINQLMVHWARISRDRVTNPQTSTSALQALTTRNFRDRKRSHLKCTNPNCGRMGHTIEDCYWPGGGKPGQFPPGFGNRRGADKASANKPMAQTSANVTVTGTGANVTSTPSEPQVFALAAITELEDDAKVPSTPHTPTSILPDSASTTRMYSDVVKQPTKVEKLMDVLKAGSVSTTSNIPHAHHVVPPKSTILLDSGASDHCFTERSLFTEYSEIRPPRTGNSAGKDSTFSIEGTGKVSFLAKTEHAISKIILSDMLHTPHLRSSLISVSKLVSRGATVSFEGDKAIVRDPSGTVILTATRRDGLYIIGTANSPPPEIHTTQSKRKPVSYGIWHRRFGHLPVSVISNMVRDELVDGLNPSGDVNMKGLCEDCIFGTHTTHPFTDVIPDEMQPLDRIYIDLWGPSPVDSAGGAKYFMLLVDGATSYRKVYFLSSKSAEVTLRAFQEFQVEAERQTGRKLKRVRLDMGREWYNEQWNVYAKERGVILDYTTPYAHQQNGRAERSMRTLLNMARAMLADAGLPQKFWADAIQIAVYIRNFIPTARNPKTVPATQWSGRRQDVSHLRPFGSTAYAHIPNEISPSKLSPRSLKLTLIGYFDRSGYKLLDGSTGRVHKSRDVTFEESPPHLSIDPIITYPMEQGASNEATAPRPKHISTLHPKTTPPFNDTLPVLRSTQTPPSPGDSESEVSQALEDLSDDDRPLAVRRTRREVKMSQRMKDSVEYMGRPKAFIASGDELTIPKSYADAMRHPEVWLEPMVKELQLMKSKGVYRVVPRPEDKNVVRSRWVFANKFDEAGNISTRKARLVAKGFTQVLGEDYDETYASVARLESVRLVCAVAASMGLRLWQVDFVSAFLNSDNAFEVFMEQPPGFEEGGDDHVWLLLKTLYGTMQGAHDWAQTLSRTFNNYGYFSSRAGSQIRHKVEGDEITLTSTWTDDILGASSTEAGEVKAKSELGKCYELKDMGEAKFILGMKIERSEDGDVRLSQRTYCKRILERFNMTDAKPRSTPLPYGISLTINDTPQSDEEVKEMKKIPYREALGSLMWLQVATRPDLSFTVNLLSKFANNPGQKHWNALKHTLAYLKGTLDYGITYHRNGSLQPYGYVDADYAGDVDTSRSTEGHIFFVGGGPVSWASKRQDTVALSTVEAEYMAFARAVQQAIWLDKFMNEIAMPQEKPINIFADNSGSISNTQNDKNHRRTKHIRIKYHFTKECVTAGDVGFMYIPSDENLADILTKPLPKEAVSRCCKGIGLISRE